MATQKLTKAAIGFIIEKRNDWHVNYTFADIAELLKEDFGITITEQGVSKSYRKHKDDDDDAFRTSQIGKQDSESHLEVQKKRKNIPEKVKSRRVNEPIIPVTTAKDFDEKAGEKYDVNDFL